MRNYPTNDRAAARGDVDPNSHLNEPLPAVEDPGGARPKGYSAETGSGRTVPAQGPVPVAADSDVQNHASKRNEAAVLPPTGKSEPRDYTPNDRQMGADR